MQRVMYACDMFYSKENKSKLRNRLDTYDISQVAMSQGCAMTVVYGSSLLAAKGAADK